MSHRKWVKEFGDKYEPLFSIDDYAGAFHEYKLRCKECGYEFTSSSSTSYRDTPWCPHCKPKASSSHEIELAEYVRSLGVDIISNSRQIIRPLELDIYVPSKKIAIEFNGLYWHIGTSHVNKLTLCTEKGISLIQIFEDEWVNNKDVVKSMISAKLGFSDRIYARKCNVVHDVKAKDFFTNNHIQGSAPASVTIGLELRGELVCCASFGKSRYSSKAEWELIRFASKLNTTVVGGMSKILKEFRRLNRGSLITYADRRYSEGNSYAKCGFEYSHTTTPGYTYYKYGYLKRLNRQSFQKHMLKDILPKFDPSMTDVQNMVANGYGQIWDCGQLVYIMR